MALPDLQTRLNEALEARHQLILGRSAALIDYTAGGRRVQYTPADLKALDRYIAELRGQLAGGPPRSRSRVRYVVPD